MDYAEFLKHKERSAVPRGFDIGSNELHSSLFDFQNYITRWSLKLGRAAVWADCGLGKTRIAIEWADMIRRRVGGPIIILTPLAVAWQFAKEAKDIGVDLSVCRTEKDLTDGINCANYERLHKFDGVEFKGVVADESSILKDFGSKTRRQLVERFATTPYRLACTATPAPNDTMELANHAEFLGLMKRSELLSMYFINDGDQTQKWRLKRHAVRPFWRWVASWAVGICRPHDLGFRANGFDLPPLNIETLRVSVPEQEARQRGLLFWEARSLSEQRQARKKTIGARVDIAAELVRRSNRPWILWCDLNDESMALVDSIPGAVEVTGSQNIDEKEKRLLSFASGETRVLVTKPSICGHGLNWQHCSDVVFVGLTHSFERWYQAIRRTYRFGQKRSVNCRIVISDAERSINENLERKRIEHAEMIRLLGEFHYG